MPQSTVLLPQIISSILVVLASVGVAIAAFMAPSGRKGLTGAASGLMLVSSIVFLILAVAYFPVEGMLANLFGGRTAWIVLTVVDYLFLALFDVGLILLVFAATRRIAKPRPSYPPHAPVGPYQPGPAQR